MSQLPRIEITLPDWLSGELVDRLETPEERMAYAIRLADLNVENETGGPFGAAIFEVESGKLVAAGVNRVIPANTSIAHAETVALALAQQALGTFDLSAEGLPAMQLVASSQPCVQCFGNTWWSGVRSLLVGARGDDVESILGFEEGPLPANWPELLQNRGPLPPIEVQRDLLREEACASLARYLESGALVYNAGSAKPE